MILVKGGVTAPKGFKASGVSSGVKKSGNKDLALIYSEATCVAVGVYTTNVVKGHSLQLTMKNMNNGYVDAVLINSGCANACVGQKGISDAIEITKHTGKLLNCDSENVLFGSTGVIGIPLNVELIKSGIDECVKQLSNQGGHDAASAIMTTDTISKEIAVDIVLNGNNIRIGGIAKGSGMIHPNMATMISIITTDANISKGQLEPIFKRVINKSFNRVSIDGDTSVCDMAIMLANGEADDDLIESKEANLLKFENALEYVCTTLSKMIAKDGEGATKLIEVKVQGAISQDQAYNIALSVAKSPLVKTAIFGEDANWGRIITAVGYSGANFHSNLIDIYIGDVKTCERGVALTFDEEKAKTILQNNEVLITIDLNMGLEFDRFWTCDLSYDYVKINGSYRS